MLRRTSRHKGSELVVGQAENGLFYSYVPESAQVGDAISALEAGRAAGQALGGESFVTPLWTSGLGTVGSFTAMELLAGVAGVAGVAGIAAAAGSDDEPSIATISIQGDRAVEEGDPAVYTVSIDQPALSSLVVTIRVSDISTNGDIVTQTMDVTIPAGQTEVSFSIDNVDDRISENPEDYKVEIVSFTNGGFDSVTRGTDQVITTITDESAPYDPANPDDLSILTDTNTRDAALVSIVGPASVIEGDTTTPYTVTVDQPASDIITPIVVDLVYSGVAQDGTDFTGVTQVTIPAGSTSTSFTIDTLDDVFAEDVEQFTVSIGTITDSNFEDIQPDINANSVNTDISDNTATNGIPNDPNDPNDGSEADSEPVLIKLIALDGNGDPILDVNGDYTFANSVDEGNPAGYMALAFAPGETTFSPATRLSVQEGTVNVSFSDGTASGASSQTTNDGTQDYNNTAQVSVALGSVITTDTFNDIVADSGETYTIAIDANSYARPSVGGYEDVSIDTAPVTTTINDGATTTKVYVQLISDSTVAEGSDLTHTVKLVDETGADVTVAAGETITVTIGYSGYGTDQAADGTDYTGTATVQIVAGTSQTTFTNPSIDDYFNEADEQYIATITGVSQANATYEAVLPHTTANGAPSDLVTAIGTILDNEPGQAVPDEGSYDTNDTLYVRIVNDDAQAEGSTLSHTLELVDINGNPVTVEAGETITVTLTYTPSGTDGVEADDYNAPLTVDIVGGSSSATVSVDALDDYFNENDETYTVSIAGVAQANATYENVVVATVANGYGTDEDTAVGTILDNEPGQAVPDEGGYDANDTVYVQLLTDATSYEIDGNTLTHTLQLVDQNGNPVNLPVGESVTVNFAYDAADTASDADLQGGKVLTFTINGDGGNSYTFSNIVANDTTQESTETYTISISSASSTYFENMEPDPGLNGNPPVNSATGTIIEMVELQNETDSVVEGSVTRDDTTAGFNLLDNDEIGVNGVITQIAYLDETGSIATAALVGGTVTVDTQYGSVTVNEDGTWSYTSDPTESNSPSGVDDIITYTVTDDNGNSDTATLTMTVTDTDPAALAPDSTVDEDDLSNGSDQTGSVTVTQNFNITKGADDISDVKFDATTLTTLTNKGLQSGGVALTYALSNGDHTVTATAGGTDIFTITILNPNDPAGTQQQYEFTLLDVIDHPIAGSQDRIDIPFDYVVADTDSQVAGSQFLVTVVDDVPTANAEPVLSVVEGNVALTGMIDLMANDVSGADDPISLVDFTYTDESGSRITSTQFGTQVDTQYGLLTVNSDGSWSYISDATENNESGTDAAGTNDFVTDSFDYRIVDADGDTATATQQIQVTDGADPSIAPVDTSVNESDLGSNVTLGTTSVTGSLGITKGTDDIANTVFTATQTALEALGLTSGGTPLSYAVSADGYTITATAGATEVFTVVLNSPTDIIGVTQSYTFTLKAPIDHTQPTNDLSWDLPFEVSVYDSDNANGIDGDDDATANFTVTVFDSAPSAAGSVMSTTEDNAVTIRISQDTTSTVDITTTDGTLTSVSTGNSVAIYDRSGNDIIGSLQNNGDGTLTFTPAGDYSNYDWANNPTSFDYSITDNDGDTATATVTIEVDPVADAPSIAVADVSTIEDNSNTQEGSNTIGLGLTLPSKSTDQTDQNDINGTDIGDAAERMGYIVLDFTNASAVSGAVVSAGTNTLTVDATNTQVLVYITDVANYHRTDLTPAADGAWQLTQAEYEAMTITHAEDNSTNIDIAITVTSHEVDDSGNALDVTNPAYYNSVTATMQVDVLAATDAIGIAWNATGGLGSYSGTTFSFNAVDEDSPAATIDLRSIMNNTNGFEADPSGDLDGSEQRAFEITGVPPGTQITYGNATATAGTDGVARVYLDDNTLNDPALSMTIAPNYAGTITGATLTLISVDTDSDSTGVIATLTDTLDFNITVNPVADTVTLQVAQAQGNEDAGRTQGNTSNDAVAASTIDDAANGIALDIVVTTDDDVDFAATSTYTADNAETKVVVIRDVPSGGAIYYSDVNGTITVDENGTVSGSNANVSVTNNGATWDITINDFDNNAPLTFIPPHNSDADYVFNVDAYTIDGSSTSIAQTLQIDVTVNGVADIPINDALATTTVTDDNGIANTFNIVGTEDNAIDLQSVLATPSLLDSYDSDGSEQLSIKITNLADGFDLQGATYVLGSGTGRIWIVDVAQLQAGNVTLTTPDHFAGELSFDMIMTTTEREGDSKTHPAQTVNVMVTPQAEGVLNNSTTQLEDEDKILDFSFSSIDTDTVASDGVESVQSFEIDVTGLEAAGITLVTASRVDLTTGKSGYQTVLVSNGVPEAVTAILAEDSHVNGGYAFDFRYVIQDITTDSNGNTYTGTVSKTDTYTVNVTAVTDAITIDSMVTTNADAGITDDGLGNLTIDNNGIFYKTITLLGVDSDGRGALDQDGSEAFTRIEVTGVPEGIQVGGIYGVYAGDTGAGSYSGVWYVDIPDQLLNGSTTYDLEFNVDGAFTANDTFTITVTAFNEDNNNGVEQSASSSFGITIGANDLAGDPATVTPATIDAFYQDIDNDGTGDHGYTVSPTGGGTITDTDAYALSILREDTTFTLDQVINVGTTGSSPFSITLTNVPAGVTITGMVYNTAGGFYTLSGNGDATAIVSALQSIAVTPPLNENSSDDAASDYELAFDIELTTYGDSGAANTALVNLMAAVLPVTDPMDLTVSNDGVTDEDVAQNFTVTLDNAADGSNFALVDGNVYLQVTETYSDIQGTDGVNGSLYYNGTLLVLQTIVGVPGIADGDYYVVSGVNTNDVLNFSFLPAEDRNGTVNVDVFVRHIESETLTQYDTTEMTSQQTITFDVNAVEDGFTTFTATGNDNEDTLTEIVITAVNPDSSEGLSTIVLDNVPDGFLVFYGADAASAVMANNLGVNGTTTIELEYGVSVTVDSNLWNIPLSGGTFPAFIGILPPENWSGIIPSLSISAVSDLGTTSNEIFDVTINPVVDTLTLNPTQTFGNEGTEIPIRLNANVQDLDGSETVTLTLQGLGMDAYFTANGVSVDPATISYDSGTDTYTISTINVNDINALAVSQSALSGTVNVTAQMVESDGTTSTPVSGSFQIEIADSVATTGDDTLLYDATGAIDGLGGYDTVVVKNGLDLDFATALSFNNIEEIDLSGNGPHTITGLSLDDVLTMTDGNNTLYLAGDADDNVGAVDTTGWTSQSTTNDPTSTTYVYTNGTDTVTLTVDNIIDNTVL